MLNSTSKFKAVVYDLDGTLINSAQDIAAAVNAAVAQAGYPNLEVDTVAAMVGGGAPNVCKLALEAAGGDSSDQDKVNKLMNDFMTYYLNHPVVHTTVFPGTVEGLQQLQELGFKQAICTNKSRPVMELVLERLELNQYFSAVVARTDTEYYKPDPRHLFQVCSQLDVSPEQVAFVGDTAIDLQTAKAAAVGRYYVVKWAKDSAKETGFSTDLASLADLPELLSK